MSADDDDSSGSRRATTRVAKLEVGQVGFLEVTDVTPIGAFVDWGLEKELLVPFAEQTTEMMVGTRYAIGVYYDSTGRLAGTMRVAEMLRAGEGEVELTRDQWVDGEAWRSVPELGLFVILEKAYVGLLPKTEPHALPRGAAARFRIANILPDGKLELSLRGHAHQELAHDAQRILGVLARANPPAIGDHSTSEEIRAAFGLSKKAFKRAVGRLLKMRAVSIDDKGLVRGLR